MNRRDAALHLARRYPGGIEAVAARMGKRPDTLRKELTGVEGYKWGVEDEELLVSLCQAAGVPDCLAPLNAAAANAGALVIPLPAQDGMSGGAWACLATAVEKFGTLARDYGAAFADNVITANELRTIERDFGCVVAAGQSCIGELQRQHHAGKPAPFKAA